jgi:hypothetical protein
MLKGIRIRNFKSLANVDVDLKPVTVLVGKNSSGKSSFIQCLLAVKQTADSRSDDGALVPTGNLVDLGSYTDLIYGHNVENELGLELRFSQTYRPRRLGLDAAFRFAGDYPYRLGEAGEMPIDALRHVPSMPFRRLMDTRRRVPILHITVAATFGYLRRLRRTVVNELKFLDLQEDVILSASRKGHGYVVRTEVRTPTRTLNVEFLRCGLRKFYTPTVGWRTDHTVTVTRGPGYKTKRHQLAWEQRELVRSITGWVGSLVENLAESIVHIGPLREHPRRIYLATAESRSNVGPRGESAVEMLHADYMKGESERLNSVFRWLEKLGIAKDWSFSDLAGYAYRFMLRNPRQRTSSAISDHGFGLSQVLPLVVQGFYSAPGTILLVEQPEIHLHPAAQALLADMFVEMAVGHDVQVITETHSEHIVTRLQRLVAHDPRLHDKVSIRLFEMTPRGATCSELPLTTMGRRDQWPDDFEDGFLRVGLDDAIALEQSVRGRLRTSRQAAK